MVRSVLFWGEISFFLNGMIYLCMQDSFWVLSSVAACPSTLHPARRSILWQGEKVCTHTWPRRKRDWEHHGGIHWENNFGRQHVRHVCAMQPRPSVRDVSFRIFVLHVTWSFKIVLVSQCVLVEALKSWHRIIAKRTFIKSLFWWRSRNWLTHLRMRAGVPGSDSLVEK